MKKLLLYSSLLVLSSSLCEAQDTLVLRNGQKMVVKVISVGDRITYTIPTGDKQMSVGLSKVRRIKYNDGTAFTNTDDENAVKIKWLPFFVVSGGASLPVFDGYAGNTTSNGDPNLNEYGYSGYANSGKVLSINGAIADYKGWQLTGQFSYMRHEMDASSFMYQTAWFFIDNPVVPNMGSPYYSDNDLPVTGVNANGTYYYNNYSLIGGISRYWKIKYGSIGISLMAGDLIVYTPALQGIANYSVINANGNMVNSECYFDMGSHMQNNFVLELGTYADVKITRHVFIRGQLEFQFSGTTNSGSLELINMTNGSTIYSGSYAGSDVYSTDLNVDMFNATLGIGYKL